MITRAAFLGGLAIAGVVLVLGVYQVPQPWRGALVGWLLFFASLGTLMLHLARHYFQYKTAQLITHRTAVEARAKAPARRNRQPGGVRIVRAGREPRRPQIV